jgi:hypothetical protein
MRVLAVLVVVLAFGATAGPAFGQATRTWVSGNGNDVNPCSYTAPCKTFAGAYGKTVIGGEIDVLDNGGFGTLSIGHSITIDGGGNVASILSSATTGININVPAGNPDDPTRRVVIRNVTINGTGVSGGTIGTNTGIVGINVHTNGADTIQLENVKVENFTQHGIKVVPGSGAPSPINMLLHNVFVTDTLGNPANGFEIRPVDNMHQVNALVRDSVFTGNHPNVAAPAGESGVGITADTGAHVWLTGSTVFDNEIGLKTFARQGASGVIDSFCDNQIVGNVDAGTAPNELCPKPPTPAPQIITETVPGPPQCVVPKLKGLPLSFAKRLLSAANCALGKVPKKKAKKRGQVGKVLAQKTRAGSVRAKGTKVAVTVGRR